MASSIVAYAYQAAEWHPHCIAQAFTGTDYVDAEPHLDRIEAERGITRHDVDTNVFPVPIFGNEDLYYEDGKPRLCDACLLPLDENYEPETEDPG
jgi:hypothetical protein